MSRRRRRPAAQNTHEASPSSGNPKRADDAAYERYAAAEHFSRRLALTRQPTRFASLISLSVPSGFLLPVRGASGQ